MKRGTNENGRSQRAFAGLLSLWCLFAGSAVLANSTIKSATIPLTPDLETSVWNADETKLGRIEAQIVRLVQKNPSSVYSHYLLSHLYVRRFSQSPGEMQILKTASELAEQTVDLDPSSDFGYLAMADILDLMGQTSKAVSLLTAAKKAGMTTSWRYHFHMARLQLDALTPKEALLQFEEAMSYPEVRPEIVVPYIIALIQTNSQGLELAAELQKWENKFPNPLFRQTIAASLAEQGRYTESHAIYQRIQIENPEIKEARVNDAILLYRHLNSPKAAIALLESVLSEQSKEFETQNLSMVRAHLGSAYLMGKMAEKAKQSYLSAYRISGNGLALLDFVSNAYKAQKQYSQLIEVMEVLSLEQNGVGHAFALMGQTLSENLNRQDDAIKAYAKAIVLDPQRPDFYTGIGLAYYRLNNLAEALSQFRAAGRLDPNDATAKYNQACVLAKLGKSEDAIVLLQEALNLDPKLQDTARSDLDFASIRSTQQFRTLVDREIAKDEAIAH